MIVYICIYYLFIELLLFIMRLNIWNTSLV